VFERGQFVTLESSPTGNRQVVDDGDGRSGGLAGHAANMPVVHRQFVFLDARAFLPGQQAERTGDADTEMSDQPSTVRTKQTATHEERRDE
jgi:hypothetical protein